MKMTARDKKLVILLGIVIFLAVFFKFLLLPKLDNITTLNADIDTLSNTYAMNMTYKTKIDTIDSDIKILSRKLKDLREIYPPSIGRDEVLIVMRDLINESKLEVNSMKFENATLANLQEKKAATAEATVDTTNGQGEQQAAASTADVGNQLQQQTKGIASASSNIQNYLYLWGLISQQADGDNESVVIPDGKGYSISVIIDAEGTNEQVKAFFSSLSELKNKTYCKAASISELSKGKSLDGTDIVQKLKLSAEIAFYGIMDKGAGEYYMLPDGKWLPTVGDGRTNVFEEYSGYELSNSGNSSNSNALENGNTTQNESSAEGIKLENYDFSMVASAFGGGLAPSVAIACKNPEEKTTYSSPVVYGDNKGIENAELFIEKKSGKYYCKFKTDHESYPDKQYKETFEFVPVGKDLRLILLSSQRSGPEDKSGVNINIINNTDKNLKYEIKYEDAKAPRVKIGKTVGSVSINNG